jgi:hypothetical protein
MHRHIQNQQSWAVRVRRMMQQQALLAAPLTHTHMRTQSELGSAWASDVWNEVLHIVRHCFYAATHASPDSKNARIFFPLPVRRPKESLCRVCVCVCVCVCVNVCVCVCARARWGSGWLTQKEEIECMCGMFHAKLARMRMSFVFGLFSSRKCECGCEYKCGCEVIHTQLRA